MPHPASTLASDRNNIHNKLDIRNYAMDSVSPFHVNQYGLQYPLRKQEKPMASNVKKECVYCTKYMTQFDERRRKEKGYIDDDIIPEIPETDIGINNEDTDKDSLNKRTDASNNHNKFLSKRISPLKVTSKTKITTKNDPNNLVVRVYHLGKVIFECKYSRNMSTTLSQLRLWLIQQSMEIHSSILFSPSSNSNDQEYTRNKDRNKIISKLKEGDSVQGIVKNLTDWGVFVDLNGVDALLHITDISWSRINKPSELLSLGQSIKVKITKIEPVKLKISVSIKHLTEDPYTKIINKV